MGVFLLPRGRPVFMSDPETRGASKILKNLKIMPTRKQYVTIANNNRRVLGTHVKKFITKRHTL